MTNNVITLPQSNTVAPISYKTLVLRSVEEFKPYRRQWTELLKAAGIENLSMSYGWLVNWLTHFPVLQVAIVIVTDENDQWVAGAPLKISRLKKGVAHKLLRQLHFIGTHPTIFDWMRIAVVPHVDEDKVLSVMAEALLTEPWDVMALVFNDQKSPLEALQRAFQNLSVESEIQESMILPYIPLPASEEEYKVQRGKKNNTRVRHCYNRFKKQLNVLPELVFQPSDAYALVDQFVAGHIQYWGEQGFSSNFRRFPQLKRFYLDMLQYSQTEAEDGDPKFVFTTLEANGEPMSFHFGFLQGKDFLCHITHYDEQYKFYSPGLVHMDQTIFYTLAQGGTRFEFGRGDEPYKKIWTETNYALWSMVTYRNMLSKGLWQADFGIKKLLKKPIGFLEP